jgi:DNA-binding Lrp family transcriptional regulator
MIEIDKKDREILFHLSLNGRASLAELSKKTKLSKEVIHYRLKNLEKSGVIEGYYAVINTYKIGKVFFRVYMKTINMTNKIESEFIEFLKNHPKVTWVVEVDGDFDFLYVVWANDIIEFEKVYKEINDRFGKYMQEKFFSVMTNVYYFKYKYLVGRQDGTFKLTGGELEYPKLDDLDLKLISLLSNQGRMSLVEIANKLNSNPKLIKNRMKRLEKIGIITCYNVKINHKLLGYAQRKVMLNLNDISSETIQRMITFLTFHPSTIYITMAIGQYDIEFEMMESSHQDFHDLLKDIKNRFPRLIKSYYTVIFYHEPKVGQFSFYK